jgi:elongation factor G
MKSYMTKDIRNIAVLGGSGSGKTTLIEAAAFASGKTNRLGSVLDGNTLSDYDEEEIKRGFSINLSVVPIEWKGCKINFFDAPGGLDFVGESESAVSAADAAIIVINARKGTDAGTAQAWKLCDKYSIPRVFFVTGMDDDTASYREIVTELTREYGSRIAPFHMPIRKDQRLVGYADITQMRARKFNGIGKFEDFEIPDYCMENLKQFKGILDEAVASVDEDNLEKYFSGEEFTQQEKDSALRANCCDGSLVPVTMGSGLHVHGVYMLLDVIVKYMPSPFVAKTGINVADNSLFDCIYDGKDYFVARVFKTISDPYIGKYSLVKIYSGTLKPDSTIFNPSYDTEIKVGKLYYVNGDEYVPADALCAGDVGAIPKLNCVSTGDTLSTKVKPVKLDGVEFPKPYTVKGIRLKESKDDEKLSQALAKVSEEDPTFKTVSDTENNQRLVMGIGEQQLEVIINKLSRKYKIQAELVPAKVGYKETICKEAVARCRYKKQTGGHGQFAEVEIAFMPSGDRELPYVFEKEVVGGAVSKGYFPAVEKGIADSVKEGLLAGYPVVGLKAVLRDGAEHPVDSSENAFKMAAVMAYKEAYLKAEPIILEPFADAKIYTPSKYAGDISSDLKTKRARILGMMTLDNGDSYIEADIPMEQMEGYMAKLRSITEGFGTFEYSFERYGQAPAEVVDRLVAEYKARKE